MAKAKQPQPRNFEDAVGELEQILHQMEAGEVPLEESITRYERGNFLLQYCRQVLTKAEQQIEAMASPTEAAAPPVAEPIEEQNEDGD